MQTGSNAGKALFVWGRTTTLYSWTWTGTAWEAALISKASAATGNIRWLALAADPGSDDILVALSDDSRNLYRKLDRERLGERAGRRNLGALRQR